jgi:3-hydroxy-3-methylglutaryl CoA synthase
MGMASTLVTNAYILNQQMANAQQGNQVITAAMGIGIGAMLLSTVGGHMSKHQAERNIVAAYAKQNNINPAEYLLGHPLH